MDKVFNRVKQERQSVLVSPLTPGRGNQDATLLCGVEAGILMKTQPPPEPHAQLPQAGEGLQVQEAGFTFGRTQPQQGQETLAGARGGGWGSGGW